MSLFNLKNKSFLITGSSKGIGKSIAFHAASHGAKVIISSRKIDACKETANEINKQIGSELAYPIAGNIAHESELVNLVEETNKQLGKIDVLICNAATNPFMGSMADIPSDAFDKVMNNNIKANHIGFKPYSSTINLNKTKEITIILESEVLDLDRIVVTGTRSERHIKNTPILTHVITNDDISNSSYSNVKDIIQPFVVRLLIDWV